MAEDTAAQGLSPSLPGDDSPYWIESPLEIKHLLKTFAKRNEKLTIWLSPGQFFVSMVLSISDANELVLDFGVDPKTNARTLIASKVMCVASFDRIDVKFELTRIKQTKYDGAMAFVCALPARVHKLQRREFYRVPTPLAKPVFSTLVIPPPEGTALKTRTVQAQVVDISLGGICIMDPGGGPPELLGNLVCRGCTMMLPEFGQVSFDLLICHIFEVETRGGIKKRRAGCKFLALTHGDQTLVQRYMTKLERDRKAVAS